MKKNAKWAVGVMVGLLFATVSQTLAATAVVDDTKQYQTIEGFGGCAWYHGWGDIWADVTKDLGATMIRFAYDQPLDYAAGVVKVINERGKIDYPIRYIASSWTPPSNMKVNGSSTGECPDGVDGCSNRIKDDMMDDYAQHTAQYIKNFKTTTGSDLYALSFQNEPFFGQTYQSCTYAASAYVTMLKELKQELTAQGLNTLLFGAEDMALDAAAQYSRGYARAIAADPQALAALDRFAVHGYTNGVNPGDVSTGERVWKTVGSVGGIMLKGKPVWMTETSGYALDYTGALGLALTIQQSLLYAKLSAWVFWTLSNYSGSDDVYDIMEVGSKSKRYYVSKNFYRYIRPEAVMVDVSCDDPDLMVSSFIHGTQKTMTVVAINTSGQSKTLTLAGANLAPVYDVIVTSASDNCVQKESAVSGRTFTLPAQSVVTLYGTGYTPQQTSLRPAHSSTRGSMSALRAVGKQYSVNGKLLNQSSLKGTQPIVTVGQNGYVHCRIAR